MAAAEDPILTLLKEVAAQKGVTLHGLDGKDGNPIGISEVNAQGTLVGSIEVHENGEKVGGIGYTILMTNVLISQTKSGNTMKEKLCIRIPSFHVTKQGVGLGSLLLAAALWVGLKNGCTYSTLNDMSDKELELQKNIYSKFGFTHTDLIEIENDKLKGSIEPTKQLKLPNEAQMLRNFQAKFKMTGGKRKINCTALYKTRKVQAILNKVWKEKSKEVIKKTGTLAHFQWKDFRAGFKKGFMDSCKSRKAKRA
jgi:hypothetical protein